ncbi:MAG: hypothetical protein M0Q53_03590 [Prolixibacteraceae bacterium]|jgi:hypothetical protein|nr:hypothetical protein [Prolixibacteraceae bacterium]
MQNRSSTAVLRDTIQLLETEQKIEGRLLKEQFYLTYESLKPVNLLRGSIRDVASSPYLIDNIIGTAVGLATGYLSRKIVIGTSGNLIRKLFGFLLQLGVTNTVAQHPGSVKSIGQYIYQHFLHKKSDKSRIL